MTQPASPLADKPAMVASKSEGAVERKMASPSSTGPAFSASAAKPSAFEASSG